MARPLIPTCGWCTNTRKRPSRISELVEDQRSAAARRSREYELTRYRRVPREPLLRRDGRIRQGSAGRHPDAGHRSRNSRPGHRGVAPAADSSGRVTPGAGRRIQPAPPAADAGRTRRSSAPATPGVARHEAVPGRSAAARRMAVLRERDQCAPPVRGGGQAGPFKDGINDLRRLRATIRARSTRRSPAPNAPSYLRVRRARPAQVTVTVKLRFRPRPSRQRRRSRYFDLSASRRTQTGVRTSSTKSCRTASPDPDARTGAAAARWRGCCGPSSSICIDVRRWLDGDPAQPKPPARTRPSDATATGGI